MKTCPKCGMKYPESFFIRKRCYVCVIQNWPPRTKRQMAEYEIACAIRLCFATPVSDRKKAVEIVRAVGLENLQKMQDIIDGKVVSFKPMLTFTQRLIEEVKN